MGRVGEVDVEMTHSLGLKVRARRFTLTKSGKKRTEVLGYTPAGTGVIAFLLMAEEKGEQSIELMLE